MFRIGSLILALLALTFVGDTAQGTGEDTGASSSGSTVFQLIAELTGEERPWAKPIEEVDMDSMRRLAEAGLLTFHEADWFVRIMEDDE